MYGASSGQLLIFVILLSLSLPLLMVTGTDMPQKNCTDGGLSIAIRCKTKSNSGRGSATTDNQCCLLGLRQTTTAEKFQPSSPLCGPKEVQTNTTEKMGEFTRISTNEDKTVMPSECEFYELRVCQGNEVQLQCNCSSCSGRRGQRFVDWKSNGEVKVYGPSYVIPSAGPEDSAAYVCHLRPSSNIKSVAPATVRIVVQHPPLIVAVPKASWSVKDNETMRVRFECNVQGMPPATVTGTWHIDADSDAKSNGASSSYKSSSTIDSDCTTRSFLDFLAVRNMSAPSAFRGNYTCVAVNVFGSATKILRINGLEDLTEEKDEEEGERRPFNVTGFIIGMLPPLFISFYIILKLGYRSRYAEERPEDDGYREEPFFVGY